MYSTLFSQPAGRTVDCRLWLAVFAGMARRQAAPKPEELIAKVEERLDTFREDVTAKLDLQLRHKQNMSAGIKAVSVL